MNEKSLSLRLLVKKNWGKSSNFLLGINYSGSEGDLWTSLALKKEIKRRTDLLPRISAKVDKDLLEIIPSWVSLLSTYEDCGLDNLELKGNKNTLDFLFVGERITKKEFYFIFANACLRNANIFFFQEENDLKHNAVRKFACSSGDIFVMKRDVMDYWIDNIHDEANR
jgi:hypothetical protein